MIKFINKNYLNVNNDIELTITSHQYKKSKKPCKFEKMLLKYQPMDKVMEIPKVDTFGIFFSFI